MWRYRRGASVYGAQGRPRGFNHVAPAAPPRWSFSALWVDAKRGGGGGASFSSGASSITGLSMLARHRQTFLAGHIHADDPVMTAVTILC